MKSEDTDSNMHIKILRCSSIYYGSTVAHNFVYVCSIFVVAIKHVEI